MTTYAMSGTTMAILGPLGVLLYIFLAIGTVAAVIRVKVKKK